MGFTQAEMSAEEKKEDLLNPDAWRQHGDIGFVCWSSNSAHTFQQKQTVEFSSLFCAEEITDKDVKIVQSIFDKVHEEETKEVRVFWKSNAAYSNLITCLMQKQWTFYKRGVLEVRFVRFPSGMAG